MTEPEHARLPWRKSSMSASGDCVEVAVGREHVYLRDSAQIGGPVLAFLYREWEAFVAGVLNGEFSLSAPEAD